MIVLDVYWKHISGSEPLQNVRYVRIGHGEEIRGANFRNSASVSAINIRINHHVFDQNLKGHAFYKKNNYFFLISAICSLLVRRLMECSLEEIKWS